MFKSNTFRHIPCPHGIQCRMGNICYFNHSGQGGGIIPLESTQPLKLEIDFDSLFSKSKNIMMNNKKLISSNTSSATSTVVATSPPSSDNEKKNNKKLKPTATSKIKSIESNSEKILKTKQTTSTPSTTKTIVLPPKKQILQDTSIINSSQPTLQPATTISNVIVTQPLNTPNIHNDSLTATPIVTTFSKLKTSIWNPALKNVLSKAPSKEITDILSKENAYDNSKWISLGIDPTQLPTIHAEARTKVPKSVRQTMLYYIIERCIEKTSSRMKAIEEGSKIEEIIYADSLSKNVYLNLISMELPKLLSTLESNT